MLKGELDPRKLAASRLAIINVVIRAVLLCHDQRISTAREDISVR